MPAPDFRRALYHVLVAPNGALLVYAGAALHRRYKQRPPCRHALGDIARQHRRNAPWINRYETSPCSNKPPQHFAFLGACKRRDYHGLKEYCRGSIRVRHHRTSQIATRKNRRQWFPRDEWECMPPVPAETGEVHHVGNVEISGKVLPAAMKRARLRDYPNPVKA